MRVAFLLDAFPRLSETFILRQIVGVIARGHAVEIYAQRPREKEPIHPDVAAFDLPAHTRYQPAPARRRSARVAGGIILAVDGLRRAPRATLRALDFRSGARAAASLRLVRAAAPWWRSAPVDIVHAHYGPNGILALRLRELGLHRAPILTTFHGHDANVLPRREPGIYRALFDDAEGFTVSSEFMRRRLLALGAPAARIIKLSVGVDPARYPFRERSWSPGEELQLLTVGRLVEAKGIGYALRAVARLRPRFPRIRYRVIGEGPDRARLEGQIRHLGLEEAVQLLGGQPRDALMRHYADAHIFILPSVVARDGAEEGQGLVLLEAQAVGLPVVASRIGGIPESVVAGSTGVLVPERDPAALAAALTRLLENPAAWAEMGRRGRAHVAAHYDIERWNDRLIALYRELLAASRGG